MPNTKSSKKRLRQSISRREINRATKSSLKKRIRSVREAATKGESAATDSEFRLAAKQLDRAGAHGVIHPNKAARLKSRLQRLIKAHKK
ncbi:MAG TPA: 30S ribosomal protein S20 [Pirellulaceae bacterium]